MAIVPCCHTAVRMCILARCSRSSSDIPNRTPDRTLHDCPSGFSFVDPRHCIRNLVSTSLVKMSLADVVGDPAPFLDRIFAGLASVGINVDRYQLDHMCYRVETNDEYEVVKKRFEGELESKLLVENIISGRMIATYKIKTPYEYKGRMIDVIELPSVRERILCLTISTMFIRTKLSLTNTFTRNIYIFGKVSDLILFKRTHKFLTFSFGRCCCSPRKGASTPQALSTASLSSTNLSMISLQNTPPWTGIYPLKTRPETRTFVSSSRKAKFRSSFTASRWKK